MNDATPRCAVPGSACRLLQLETPGTRPVWAVLDAAGARHFTGEIVLLTDPQVVVHFVGGEAYLAERSGDPALAERLVALGVVDHDQLERGIVRLGPVEHLGRLFERVPELDRHQVELALEVITAEVLGEIADHPVDEIRVASYRHHPSGVQRWLRTTPVAPAADGDIDASADVEPLPDDVALLAEYEQLLADHPPTDQFAPTVALPVITPAIMPAEGEPVDTSSFLPDPEVGPDPAPEAFVAPEPEPEPEPAATDATEWAVESVWEWPVEPTPEPVVDAGGIWDLPVEGPADETVAVGDIDEAPLGGALDLPPLTPLELPSPTGSGVEPAPEATATDGGLRMPDFDVASILQQVRESEGGPALPPMPPDEGPVDDDVRAAVRAALAEIEAAARGQLDPADEALPAFALDPVTAPSATSGPATAAPAPTPVLNVPTLPTPRLPAARPAAAPAASGDADPLADAIASVAAELPSAVEAAGAGDTDEPAPPAPRPDEMPAGGLRRLIGGIRKP